MWKKRAFNVVPSLLPFAPGIFFLLLPAFVEHYCNRTIHSPLYRASQKTVELHRALLIAGRRLPPIAGSLLCGRNLPGRDTRGRAGVQGFPAGRQQFYFSNSLFK